MMAGLEVADAPDFMLRLGKFTQKGFRAVLDVNGSYLEKNGKRVKLVMKKNLFYLRQRVLQDQHLTHHFMP